MFVLKPWTIFMYFLGLLVPSLKWICIFAVCIPFSIAMLSVLAIIGFASIMFTCVATYSGFYLATFSTCASYLLS
ncbi:hypothetical protein B0O99DRAFT_120110 [Bisporella sp. PMI_857]|nr:hypothetical protein B0O99DRAFT_120110 [Bisporella sp. PMI_857]